MHSYAAGNLMDLEPPDDQPWLGASGWGYVLSVKANAAKNAESGAMFGVGGNAVSRGLMPQADGSFVAIAPQV